MVTIRQAQANDIQSITEIYNEAITSTVSTFDIAPKSLSEQNDWFMMHGPKNPILVAEKNNIIVGWAALSKWSNRCAYKKTAEISVYVKKDYQGKNIGRNLLKTIIKEGENVGLHTLLALITGENMASIHLHESLGFFHIGVIREVGYKFGRRLDVCIMQKIYPSPPMID